MRISRRECDREAGMTMTEVIVAMSIMSIFMAIFTGAIISIYRTSNSVEASTLTSNQLGNAFVRLDKTVRYASAISQPSAAVSSGGSWYVEIQTTNTGSIICTQLQLNTTKATLNTRTWTVSKTGTAGTASAFTLLANQVTADGTPFALSNNSSVYEQLQFNLKSVYHGSSSSSAVQFTALNSAAAAKLYAANSAQPATVCNQDRP